MQQIFKSATQGCLSDFDADDETLLEWVRLVDPYFEKDIRGRSIGDDWRDYLIAFRASAGKKGAIAESPRSNPDSFRAQWASRAKALCEYWQQAASATVHNRDLWSQFLSANGLPATSSHEQRIGGFERRLLETLAKKEPGPEWTSQALILSQAYVDERSTVARRSVDNRPVNYQSRESPCPEPVTHGYGKPRPEVGDRSRSLTEFYPAELRRTGTEGDVILSIRVNAAGCAVEAGIAVSSGSPALDKAALQWYETASFLPAEKAGKTVEAIAVLPMEFRLVSPDTNGLGVKSAQFANAENLAGASGESSLTLRRMISFANTRIPGALLPPVTVVEGNGVFQESMREQCRTPQTSASQTGMSRLLQQAYRSSLLIRPVDCDKPRQAMHLIIESEPLTGFADLDSGWVQAPLPRVAQLASAFFAIAEPDATHAAPGHAIPFDILLEYDIQLPAGYSADSPLPIRKVDLGAATLELRAEERPDHRVILTAEFHSPQSTYSADQRAVIGQGLQRASLEQLSLKFTFDAHRQLASGLEREALASYRAFSDAAPRDAYRHAAYAFGLDRLCLPDEARAELHKSIGLDQHYAYADYALGWQLMIDPLCRARAPPFDYGGAERQFRQAIQLQPDAPEFRFALAQLLEYDASGVRFGRAARLEEALKEFGELRSTAGYGGDHDDEILEVMLLLGHHGDLHKLIASLSSTAHRQALSVASTAVEKGTDGAVAAANDLAGGEDAASQLLASASSTLEAYRFYPQAVALLEATRPKFGEAEQRDSRLALLKHVQPHENIVFAPSDAREPVIRALELLLGRTIDTDRLAALMSPLLTRRTSATELAREMYWVGSSARQKMQAGEFPNRLIDQMLARLSLSSEGDDTVGYRVRVTGLAQQPIPFFVVREGEQLRLLGTSYDLAALGTAALDSLDSHRVDAARQLLKWAHESVALNPDADSLESRGFAHLWPPETGAPEDELRVAAASLAAMDGPAERELDVLKSAYRSASGARRQDLAVALSRGYLSVFRWRDAVPVLEEVWQANPRWKVALQMLIHAELMLGDFGAADRTLEGAETGVGDAEVKQLRATILFAQGDLAKARALLGDLIDSGNATAVNRNNLGWVAVAEPFPDTKALDTMRNLVTERRGQVAPALYHTLACLYAVNGRGAEARDALRGLASGFGGTISPDQVLLVQGLLAESYGERAVARRFYEQAMKETDDSSPVGSPYMAKLRLKLLDKQISR